MIHSVSYSDITNLNKTQAAANTNVSSKDVKKLVKYANNEALTEKPDTFASTAKSAATSAAVFEGIPLVKFASRTKKLTGSIKGNSAMQQLDDLSREALKKIKNGEGSLTSRVFNYVKTANDNKKIYSDVKQGAKAARKLQKLQKESDKVAAKLAKGKGKQASADIISTKVKAAEAKSAEITGKINNLISGKTAGKAEQTAAAALETTAEKNTKKSGSLLSKIPGVSKVAGKLKAGASKLLSKVPGGAKIASKLGKVGKFMKSSGAGFMLVFSGITEFMTEVVPTYKELGAAKGTKQLGKSLIKVAGDTLGFVAGEQLGVAAGTAIGTALFPGIGTAIGAAVGFVGGMLGSFAAGKITNKITGKSEREIAKEQQQESASKEIANNSDELEQLKQEVYAKLQNEYQTNGQLSEDGKTAQKILNNLGQPVQTNPFGSFQMAV